jgi:hypothetical protein
MLFVAIATVVSMFGEVQSYYEAFSERWLLALMGTLILAFDVWVILEGFKMLLSDSTETVPELETRPWT